MLIAPTLSPTPRIARRRPPLAFDAGDRAARRVQRGPAIVDADNVWVALDALLAPGQVRASAHRAADTRWVVRGASLAVWPGELVLLVGPAGVRRAAFLGTIDGALVPTHGCVRRSDRAVLVRERIDSAQASASTRALIDKVWNGAGAIATVDVASTANGDRLVTALRRRFDRAVPCRVVWFLRGRCHFD